MQALRPLILLAALLIGCGPVDPVDPPAPPLEPQITPMPWPPQAVPTPKPSPQAAK